MIGGIKVPMKGSMISIFCRFFIQIYNNLSYSLDLQAFWSGIVRTDLFDEVVQDVVTQVLRQTIICNSICSPLVSWMELDIKLEK